jgi:hypothetical protein
MVDLSIIVSAIAAIGVEGAWERTKRSEAVIRLLGKLGINQDQSLDDFESVYKYALIEYGIGKSRNILDVFREGIVQDAFRKSFASGDMSIISDEIKQLCEWHRSAKPLAAVEIQLEHELLQFMVVFAAVTDRTRSPADVRRDLTLRKIHEDLHIQMESILETANRLSSVKDILAEIRSLLSASKFTEDIPQTPNVQQSHQENEPTTAINPNPNITDARSGGIHFNGNTTVRGGIFIGGDQVNH